MPLVNKWRVRVRYRLNVQRKAVCVRTCWSGALTDHMAVQCAMEEYAHWKRTTPYGEKWVLVGVEVIDEENVE